jgi:hypothetical protein
VPTTPLIPMKCLSILSATNCIINLCLILVVIPPSLVISETNIVTQR